MSDAEVFLDAVSVHAGTAIERCRDRWGPTTGLLADGYDLTSHEPVRWEAAIISDLSCQQNLIRCLDGLVHLTGADLWQQVVDEWIGGALAKLTDPASDLWYWGGHTAWDLGTDQLLRGNHELKCVFPFYDFLYRTEPAATSRFIDAFWHAHIWDWSSLLFNRHGEYESWDRDTCWREGPFAGTGSLPLVENTALSFINTGADLIYAATEAHHLTGAQEPLDWALRLLSCYDAIRHPDTDLGGYQFNHRDPCRVRQSFLGEMGERVDVNETSVINHNVINTRYGRVAVCLLNQATRLGDEGRPLMDLVHRDLTALAAHSWQADAGCFQSLLNDGTLLTPAHTQDVGYCPPSKMQPVKANGLMLLAYARAYRVTGDEGHRHMAHQLAAAMGWDLTSGPVDFATDASGHASDHASDHPRHGGQHDACALEALLDLYAVDGDDGLLQAAIGLGHHLLATHVSDGLFTSPAAHDSGCTDIDSAVPVALLRLAGELTATRGAPTFYPNSTAFDPKVVIARR